MLRSPPRSRVRGRPPTGELAATTTTRRTPVAFQAQAAQHRRPSGARAKVKTLNRWTGRPIYRRSAFRFEPWLMAGAK